MDSARGRHRSRFGFAVFVGLTLPSLVRANPSFPEVIENQLDLAYAIDCALCHTGGQTSRGTVTTPMGLALRERGLVAGSTQSLTTALGALSDQNVDSDGDGAADITELLAATDPNRSASVPPPSELPPGDPAPTDPTPTERPPSEPEYGCTTGPVGSPVAAAIGLLASMCTRRRNGARPSPLVAGR